MKYLKYEKTYWRPLKKLPKTLQHFFSKLSSYGYWLIPNFDFYSDILKRAYLEKEFFWTGATIFWNNMKEKLLFERLCDSIFLSKFTFSSASSGVK